MKAKLTIYVDEKLIEKIDQERRKAQGKIPSRSETVEKLLKKALEESETS